MEKLVFVGAGSMAEAVISGIIQNQLIDKKKIWVTNRSNQEKLTQIHEQYGVTTSYNHEEIFENAEMVILAMKPKDASSAIEKIKPYLTTNMLVVSMLAGVSLESIALLAEKNISIIRAMPNTSAAIGKSATALAVNDKVTEEQKMQAKMLFDTVGLTVFVGEEQIDAVTGVSGSGPAYIYYIVEAMEKSAVELGLEGELAHALIVQTLTGAAGMLSASSKTPAQLRKDVTSPGGTTEAGLNVLGAHNVGDAMEQCIKEAADRSKRLGASITEEINEKMASSKR